MNFAFNFKQFGVSVYLECSAVWLKQHNAQAKSKTDCLEKHMCKRLRGWQLELETGQRKGKKQLADDYDDGLEKHNLTTSALATKLLALWAHGQLSAKMVRELASLAVTDGATHQDLIQIAQVGSWGEHEGNCHKELMRRFVKGVAIADPVRVKVKCIDNKTSLEKVEEADVFLPHMVFFKLG